MNIFAEILENKLLLYSIIAVIFFIVVSIILIKKVSDENDEKDEKVKVDIEKIDGENSVFDEIIEEKEKSNSNQLDLDSMIAKMQKDLDAKASEVVEKFENEQEEKSVISYQELIGNKKEEVSPIEIDKILESEEPSSNLIEDEYVEPIKDKASLLEETLNSYENELTTSSILNKLNIIETELEDNKEEMIQEVEANTIEPEPVEEEKVFTSKLNMKDEFVEALKTGNYEEKEEIINDKPVQSKFKATEFISPIYGIQDIKIQYPTVQNMKDYKENYNKYNKFELDDTLNMKKINNEVHKDEDFLNTLKEFRKNLE